MLQCCRGLDLHDEPIRAEHCGKFWFENFNRDFAIVLDVVRQVDGRHAARAELTFDLVSVAENCGEAFGHGVACFLPTGVKRHSAD